MDLKGAIEKIRQSEYKLTRARQVILETIFLQKGPFSANDLNTRLGKRSRKGTADVVTIYRNLSVFEEIGIISRCDFSDSEVMYEVLVGDQAHHHHIVCRVCHHVESLDFCIIEAQEQALKQLGYHELNHRLEFSGICPKCAANRSQTK